MDQTTKRWGPVETYGGKLVENVVQSVARDCLTYAMEQLETAGYKIVMHCHDEVVIECPAETENLTGVVDIMSQPIPWAPDLPLAADGWVGSFFKKE
jgi:DNA polymerase